METLNSSNQAMCFAFLSERGFHPTAPSQNDVTFRDNGRRYVARVDENDPGYFQLGAHGVSHFEGDEGRALTLAAVSVVNARHPAVKVFLDHDTVHLCVEMFLAEEHDFTRLFDHALKLLKQAIEDVLTIVWKEKQTAFASAA